VKLLDEHMEVEERCGGCHESLPDLNLAPISDGSMKVCEACYPNATSMFFTEGAEREVSQQSLQSAEPAVVMSAVNRSRLQKWHASWAAVLFELLWS
jgi:hypothetical protein